MGACAGARFVGVAVALLVVAAPATAIAPATAMAAATAAAGTTRVSVATTNAESGSFSYDPVISGDARFVAFVSDATNLVSGDTNATSDVFVRDRLAGSTLRISVATGGTQANRYSFDPAISTDGRYVTFYSAATNLVAGDTNTKTDVFVRDRLAGTTARVSVATDSTQGNGDSYGASVSADGRYVAFVSGATNLVAGDTNNAPDVFVRDRVASTTTRLSVTRTGAQSNGASSEPAISADGRYVTFSSAASNLVAGDTNAKTDVFVRDRVAGATTRVSVPAAGGLSNGPSLDPAISADGRYVTFMSTATNLVAGDTNNAPDVFVRDRVAGTTTRVSRSVGGAQGNGASTKPVVSADGRYVAFVSAAPNLVPGDTNAQNDVFLRDRQAGTTVRVSLAGNGVQGNAGSYPPAISTDVSYVAFGSRASNLVAGDTNALPDVFVRQRR